MTYPVASCRSLPPARINDLQHSAGYPGLTPNNHAGQHRGSGWSGKQFASITATQPECHSLTTPSQTPSSNPSIGLVQSDINGQRTPTSHTLLKHGGRVDSNPNSVQTQVLLSDQSVTGTLCQDLETDSSCGDLKTDTLCEDLVTDTLCQDLETDSSFYHLETFCDLETDSSCRDIETDTPCRDLETDTPCRDLETDTPCRDLEIDSSYCDFQTDTSFDLENDNPAEPVGDLETDSKDNLEDLFRISLSSLTSDNTSISSIGILPRSTGSLHCDDQNVPVNEDNKTTSYMNMSELNDIQTDGFEETEVKLYEESHDQWPQENGCAFGVKAVDMDRRRQIQKPTVNKIARTYEDFVSTEYNHGHLYRGRCLIISNSEFQAKSDRPKRTGSLRDAKTLRRQFLTLGFHPIKSSDGSEEMIHQNLSPQELLQTLSEATDPSLNDYSDYDCFVCVILSYGVAGAVVCAGETDDVFVEMNVILEHFTPQQCPSLAMKPKLFFIQGCTPYEIIENQAMATNSSSNTVHPTVTTSLPSMADCLVQFSGVDGNLGWVRNRRRGLSFYVQALCESLKTFCILKVAKGQKSQEMSSLILRINRAFVRILEEDEIIIDEDFCVPSTISTLTKRMYFYPKIPQNDLEMDTG